MIPMWAHSISKIHWVTNFHHTPTCLKKLVTCLIYCAEDNESSDMGTSLFKLKDGFRANPEKYYWYDFSQFDEIKDPV